MSYIDIVGLIESNPVTKLKCEYKSKLVNKIKGKFNDTQQQLFVASFYCYLNYHPMNDFIVKVDDIWKWLGFARQDNAIRLIKKQLVVNVDYKVLLLPSDEQNYIKKGSGGHNKQHIILTVHAFKKLCLKSNTKKADEIHEYFIGLEEIIHELTNEESDELKHQLMEKDNTMKLLVDNIEVDKQSVKERTLIEQNPKNTLCIYYALIDNKSLSNETLVKFGRTNDLSRRIGEHKKVFTNFRLIQVFKVSNNIEIENIIKTHEILRKNRRSIIINDMNYTELIAIDNKCSLVKIDEYIATIIEENEYNLRNYQLMLKKLEESKVEINTLNAKILELETLSQKQNDKLNTFKAGKSDKKSNTITSVSSNAYYLYAFECESLKYKCGFCRISSIDEYEQTLKNEYNGGGGIKHKVAISNTIMEKIMIFIMKEKLMFIGYNTFNGTLEEVKMIMNMLSILEHKIINNDIQTLFNNISGYIDTTIKIESDPEIPTVRKAKRPVDQIDPKTDKVINTYPSIEEAGRKNSLTTGTAIGIALRNKTMCKGYIWRYAGISKEDQMSDQPVIKICCSTGVSTHFDNIASAGRDAGVSAPALRQRILTNVHIYGSHWVFNKTATHYN
jgi:hypothetical protein